MRVDGVGEREQWNWPVGVRVVVFSRVSALLGERDHGISEVAVEQACRFPGSEQGAEWLAAVAAGAQGLQAPFEMPGGRLDGEAGG